MICSYPWSLGLALYHPKPILYDVILLKNEKQNKQKMQQILCSHEANSVSNLLVLMVQISKKLLAILGLMINGFSVQQQSENMLVWFVFFSTDEWQSNQFLTISEIMISLLKATSVTNLSHVQDGIEW